MEAQPMEAITFFGIFALVGVIVLTLVSWIWQE